MNTNPDAARIAAVARRKKRLLRRDRKNIGNAFQRRYNAEFRRLMAEGYVPEPAEVVLIPKQKRRGWLRWLRWLRWPSQLMSKAAKGKSYIQKAIWGRP